MFLSLSLERLVQVGIHWQDLLKLAKSFKLPFFLFVIKEPIQLDIQKIHKLNYDKQEEQIVCQL